MSKLSQHALERRQNHLTATDTPKVLGISPWGGPADVYWDKMRETVEDKSTPAQAMGHWLEQPLIDFAAEKLGVNTSRRGLYRVSQGREDNGLLSCTLDAQIVGIPQAIEAKYVGPDRVDEWGEDGSDQVPADVVAQVEIQMYVAELELVWIPVLLAKYRAERRLYQIARSDELIDLMVPPLVDWWKGHIEAGVPPDGAAVPPLAILRAMRREPKTLVPIPPKLVSAWGVAKERESRAKTLRKRADRAMLIALGDAEAGDAGELGRVTFLEENRRAHSVAASRRRVLRWEKWKHG